MTRATRAVFIPFLLAPLLLGATTSEERVTKKDAATSRDTQRGTSGVQSQPAPGISPAVMDAPAANVGTSKPKTSSSAPNYAIDWSSVNGGGTILASSPSYKMGLSVGQSTAGEATSASHKVGIGFWYGAAGCNCPYQGDINGDAAVDVFDVIGVIGIDFSGDPDPQDPGCPKTRGDVDNNGATDVFDLIYLIATAFSGGPNPIDPCGP